jgi:hypothetical protein
MNKKEANAITGKDLKFEHFELAKKLAIIILQEMNKQKLGKKDIPQVLHDIMKFVVLAEAETSTEGALLVVQRIVELNSDLTILMMRIIENQMNQDSKDEKGS